MKYRKKEYSINYFFKILFTGIVLVNSVYVNAQQTKIDSLKQAIVSTKEDTIKISLYETLAQAYRDARKLDSSILAYQQAWELNRKINFSPIRQCYNMSTMAYLYYVTGNFTKSLEYDSKVLMLSEKLHDLPQMAHAHQQFGFNYMAFGDYRTALSHFFSAKELFERHNHPEIDLESPAFAIVYIGYIYLKLNQPDSALVYVQSGYKLASTMSQRYVIDFALRIFGDIFLFKNNYQLALSYYRQYLDNFYRYDENNRDIGFVFNNMANIFQKRNQNDSAVIYAKKALSNATEYHDQQNIYDAASMLSDLYQPKNNIKDISNSNPQSISVNTGYRTTINSLKKEFLIVKSDSLKSRILEHISTVFENEAMLDSAVIYAQQELVYVQQAHLPTQREVWALAHLDHLTTITGNYSLSLQYATRALHLSEQIHDNSQIIFAYTGIAMAHALMGDYRKSLDYYFKAKKIEETFGPAFWSIQNIAETYLKMHMPDSALYYNKISYHIADTSYNQQYMKAFAIRVFGAIYSEKGQDQLALKYYHEFIDNFYRYNLNNCEIDQVYLGVAKLYQRNNQTDSANYYAKKSLAAANKYKDPEYAYNASHFLYAFNDSINNIVEAFKYFKIAEAAKDSMASIEKITQIQALTFNEQVREKEQAASEAKEVARERLLIMIAAILVSIITILIWYRIRQLRLRYKMILGQKEAEKLKINYEKKLLEMEANALRSQMNPHFIFNCMNSIKALIQKQENEKAVTYLTTFSKLIRTIFQNSDKREITLFEEIETCRFYTKLESMRFGDQFNCNFNIEDSIDLKSVKVPALILQPFIENAIWHGIMPKEETGTVIITVEKKGETVLCMIDDNGIGRSNQNKFKAEPSMHQSKGVSLTQNRLDLDNLLNERKARVEIIDKKNIYGEPAGTKVIIHLTEY